VFDVSKIQPGTEFLSGPIVISKTVITGNTPRAVFITTPADLNFHRDGAPHQNVGGPGLPGPKPEMLMWADFTDGVVNVTTLAKGTAVRKFNLGANSAPNDIAMTPCLGGVLVGAISQGGALPFTGKVAYYVSGPGCLVGTSVPGLAADSIVGDKSGLDGPAGLDETFLPLDVVFFAVAESGSQSNSLTTLGFEPGANNFPRIVATFKNMGQNPTKVCHADAYLQTPCITFIADPFNCNPTHPYCWYKNSKHKIYQASVFVGGHWDDPTQAAAANLYVCARGSGQVTQVNVLSGVKAFYQPPPIPGIRFVATHATQ
jgi:hypothetical protein